jgi:hypothetical protein
MNERVWLDEKGIIHLRSTSRQPREVVDENVASIREYVCRQKASGGPVLLLIDVSHSSQISVFARRAALVYFRLGIDRFAIFGRLPYLALLMNCLAKLAGYKRLRVFTDEAPAIEYLLKSGVADVGK